MITILIQFIRLVFNILFILVVADAILSFVLPPYHQVRVLIGKVTQPLLAPIRRFVPPIGGIDISPLILIILLNVLEFLLISLLSTLR